MFYFGHFWTILEMAVKRISPIRGSVGFFLTGFFSGQKEGSSVSFTGGRKEGRGERSGRIVDGRATGEILLCLRSERGNGSVILTGNLFPVP